MPVILRYPKSAHAPALYWTEAGVWRPNLDDARTFPDADEARAFVDDRWPTPGHHGVEILHLGGQAPSQFPIEKDEPEEPEPMTDDNITWRPPAPPDLDGLERLVYDVLGNWEGEIPDPHDVAQIIVQRLREAKQVPAEPGEPYFLLLARDPHAPILVRVWADLRQVHAGSPGHVADARRTANQMDEFRRARAL